MKFDKKTITPASYTGVAVDQGLRAYMLSIYNYMGLGLALTGFFSYLVSSSPQLMHVLFGTPLMWVVLLAPVGIALFLQVRIHHMTAATAQVTFWVYAALMGVSLASIFLIYTGTSVARVFFITAGMFSGTSLYGYTTSRDLTSFGSFLFMGLLGIIIASLINVFMHSSVLQLAISFIGVLVFTGLTAYDTQRLKEIYYEGDDTETMGKKAIIGALALYLDFINLFMSLLRLLGDRRN